MWRQFHPCKRHNVDNTTAYFVADRVTLSLNSRMVQSDDTKDIKTDDNSNGATLQPSHLQSYPEAMNHLLKRYANNEAIAEADAAILCFTQLANTMPLQYTEALFAKATRIGNVHDEDTLIDKFI